MSASMPQDVGHGQAMDEQARTFDRERKAWAQERDRLHHLLAQQQRVAHAGLIASGLAHEIANYAMLISGRAYMAARSEDPARWRETLQTIPATCEEMGKTMESVLAFAGRRRQDELESFHAAQAVRQAERLLKPLAVDRGTTFACELDADAPIVGKQQMLVQALVNLGSNAMRAAGTGQVCLRITRAESGGCRITVSDDGPGIPEDLRGRLFQPFTTGEADSGGHGLGLFIVRKAVRGMGGRIKVTTGSEGTEVALEMPAAE